MKKRVLLPVVAAITMTASFAQGASSDMSSSRVALVFEQKQTLDARVRTALGAPERGMQAVCGRTLRDARGWAYHFAERSFAALSEQARVGAAGNPFIKELANAYYGRSRIYYIARIRPMRQREFENRLFGNDQRIEGIMRAARRKGVMAADGAIRHQAQESVDVLIRQNKVCN